MKYCNVRGILFCLILLVFASGALVAQNPNCTIIVPDNPLSATGLATPYQLYAPDAGVNGPCNETNTAQSAFVEAGIFDPATGHISIYSPLVIDQGTAPAIAPTVPKLPANAVVAIWFGFNGNNLTQAASSPAVLKGANCVNGLPGGNIFSQYSYCNATAFFAAANKAVSKGKLVAPALGTAMDGEICPTVRSFYIVDQDQSDNTPTTYLIASNGLLAQNVPLNAAALTGATLLWNPSDNGLLDRFVDPAIGCKPWGVPDLADTTGTQLVPGLPLDEIQAIQKQAPPMAMVPVGDPMTRDNDTASPTVGTGPIDLVKTNLYRVGVDQPRALSTKDADTGSYCRNMLRTAPARLIKDQALLTAYVSPVPAAANSLYTFLAQRFMASYNLLECGSFVPIPNPVTVTTDSTGMATSAVIDVPLYNKVLSYVKQFEASDRTDVRH